MKLVRTARRRSALVFVLLGVVGMHAWVVDEVARRMPNFEGANATDIKRLDVAFVRELEVQAPPAAMAPPVPVAVANAVSRAVMVASAASAASAPQRSKRRPAAVPPERAPQLGTDERRTPPAASAPAPPTPDAIATAATVATAAQGTDDRRDSTAEPERVASGAQAPGEPVPERTEAIAAMAASATSGGVPAAMAAAAAAVAGPGAGSAKGLGKATGGVDFEWPPSTRLTYSLVGNYRGEIEGSARVQWIRTDTRYQVHMDVVVGPVFAPLMSRRMTSDGALGERGLMPRRYQEETRVGFATRRNSVQIDGGRVLLANGSERPAPDGVQDSASQFVQLSFLFSLDPSLLTPGHSITMPVALPRRVDPWIYDVVAEEVLVTPIGNLKAVHVKPRRESPRPGELTAQAWYAPSLRYLPVRILIHQDDETFVDLLLKSAPTQGVVER